MSMFRSQVIITGLVQEIDHNTRDVTIKTINNEEVVVHFWTTVHDTKGAWKSSDLWMDYVTLGSYVKVCGYLGNNGRIVVAPGGCYVLSNSQLFNSVDAICKKVGDNTLETRTPAGKTVLFNLSNPEKITDFNDNDRLALIGYKTNNSVTIQYVEKIQGSCV